MWLEQRLLQQVGRRLSGQHIPLRVVLWNGESHDLGPQPRVDLHLNSARAVRHFLRPNLDRLGEAYVEGEIDIRGPLEQTLHIAEALCPGTGKGRTRPFLNHLFHRHSRQRDAQSIQQHYDVSNDFYALWLDRNMVYSCAYFKNGHEDIHQAQEQKLDHICRKLRLQPGEQFLDIGCGWGALILWAAKHYGVRATGVTLSQGQYRHALQRIREAGLAGQVEVRLQDYRDIPGDAIYDKIASVGMFEHVGIKQLPVYFASIQRLLKPGGLVLNHGITTCDPDPRHAGVDADSFIHRYVFPNGELAHLSLVLNALERQNLETLDVESLRLHYAQTLMHWVSRLDAQQSRALELAGERSFRIWRIYMAASAHAFQRGWISIYQVLATRQEANGLLRHPWTREYQYANPMAHNQPEEELQAAASSQPLPM